MGDSERVARPKRPTRNVERSQEFSHDVDDDFTEEWDDDNAFDIADDLGFDSDFEGFTDEQEYPDEDYQDFSTDTEEEVEEVEERPKRATRPKRDVEPERPKRAKRATRPKRVAAEEVDEPEEEVEEQVQVRHRRVRENETVEEKPQMFSFASDINRMTVTTMLQDVDMKDYAFNEEGNLIRRDDAPKEETGKAVNSMQAVESLEDLLGGLENSSVLGTDAELGKEIAADIHDVVGEKEAEAVTEVPTESDTNEADALAEELEEIAAQSDVMQSEEVVDEDNTAEDTSELLEEAEGTTGSLLSRLQDAAFTYKEQTLNREVESLSDIEIRYMYDGDYNVVPADRNSLAMPNCKVYKNNRTEKWTNAQEVRLNIGDRVEVDFGVGVGLPKGYGLAARYNEDLLSKFGLDPVEPKRVFNTLEAATDLTLSFIARSSTAYVARYQPLVALEVVKMHEGL